mmetsp:Transcript_10410/g.38385  ORF Transcript_10410/g.38385 Transcript_10410/m.38385 type:complete len:101 (-) Transcript_10410:28-330(-)
MRVLLGQYVRVSDDLSNQRVNLIESISRKLDSIGYPVIQAVMSTPLCFTRAYLLDGQGHAQHVKLYKHAYDIIETHTEIIVLQFNERDTFGGQLHRANTN